VSHRPRPNRRNQQRKTAGRPQAGTGVFTMHRADTEALTSVTVILAPFWMPAALLAQSDTTPPALTSITITPNQVKCSSSAAIFSVDLGNHRRHHGFRLGVCQFRESVGQARRERKHNSNPDFWHRQKRCFRATGHYPTAAEAGLWSISALVLQDAAGNSATPISRSPDRAGISDHGNC